MNPRQLGIARLVSRLTLVWFAALMLIAPPARLSAKEPQAAVDSARESLKSQAKFPWYDKEKDAAAPIALLPTPKKGSTMDWAMLGAFGGLGLLLGLLAFLLLRAFVNRSTAQSADFKPAPLVALGAEQVEALPFLAERSHADLLGQARRHYEQGNFSEAIIYLFSYQLVELDKSTLIHLAKGKTNRQYVREVAKIRPLKRMLESTMVAFEDVFFGQRPLDRSGFEACWRQLSEFENMVAQAAQS